MSKSKNYISSDTLPESGGDMRIISLGRVGKLKKWRVEQSYRRGDGKPTNIVRYAKGSAELALKIAEIKEITGCSLTKLNFADCVAHTLKHNNGAGMDSIYKRINDELGKHPVSNKFKLPYYTFIQKLKDEDKALNTISNYKSCIRTVLKCAVRHGLINILPIINFDIQREFRDRVWTPEERERIFNVLKINNSNIYWAVWLASQRPIRKGDLINLTSENLISIGKNTPYLRYRAKKTSKVRPVDTFLPLADLEYRGLLEYFGNNYNLFPIGDFKKHWRTVCKLAQVEDLHFHDLKHCAITYMIQSGYTFQDLADLNIQGIETAQRVYYHKDAFRVLNKKRINFVSTKEVANG